MPYTDTSMFAAWANATLGGACAAPPPPGPAPPGPANASCASYGCNISYDPAHACQCNGAPDGGCAHFKNCCTDYKKVCGDIEEA